MRIISLILMCLCLPLSLCLALPATAQTALTAEGFDAYTRGKTLYYGFEGKPYGVERYLDGQRVIWSFLDGKCKDGIWYEDNGQICFVYEDMSDPQCWAFSKGPDGLIARFENNQDATNLYEAQEDSEKMLCYGPEVGV